ncbi:AI-2E family transporter [Lutibacter sp. B1]|uniref:AI-2E family transporter n=1 Tax=Lutibacter sp. B1 TaxID=2725996 RepID=UPI00145688D5|nr:AI-2E family transporter [Lutibacter sp. B1]NLP56644.1 AI-2E family transporter [Lutibacter sp. B1]
MNSNTITKGILKAIAIVVGVLALLYFLYKVQAIIIYLAIAGVVSLIGRPLIRFFKLKLKFPETLAVIITILLFFGLLLGIASMLIPLIIKQSENLSLLNMDELQANIQDLLNEINDYFLTYNINLFNEIKNIDLFQNFKIIPNFLNSVIETIGNIGVGLFSVIFIAFFFMKDTHLMENSIYVLVNDKNEIKLRKSLSTIKNLLSRYFIGLIFQITILFVIYTIVLLIFGIENAIVIAFLCALLNLIPYIGPLVGGVIMLFLTMSSNLGQDFRTEILPTTIYVMIGYIFAQLIDNFISQPLIFSKSVKSHPLEIFIIIMIGGFLFGVTGMIIAVPTYTAIKVILKAFLADNKIVKSLTKNL